MQIFAGQVRFGIHAGPQNYTYEEYSQLWKTAEALGYDWASVFDHFVPIGSDPNGPCLEGFTLLSAMAAQTTRIRCAMLVTGNTYRNPAIVANMGATIDHVSSGRLELGLGAGWWEREHQQYGIPFYTTGRRIRALGETAQIVRSLWTEHATNFQGRYYTMTNAHCEPKPVQRPHPPIWIGGTGEQLTIPIVAASADGWNVLPLSVEDYRRKLNILAGHCKAIGRDPEVIRKSMIFQMLVRETEAEVKEVSERWGGGPQANLMREGAVLGTPAQVVEHLLPYLRAGIGDFLVRAASPADYETLELVARQVAPAIKSAAKSSGG